MRDPRGIAPSGWQVASTNDWNILINYLGGASVAGGKLKSATYDWRSPNTGATNSSGFIARPAGQRSDVGQFVAVFNYGTWWARAYNDGNYYDVSTYNDNVSSGVFNMLLAGFSVRCVKY